MLRCRGRRCFFQSGSGSEELLAALGRSQQLEASERRGPHSFLLPSRSGRQEVDFTDCDEIPDAAWELLGDGAWPRLRVAEGVPEEHLQRLRDEASLDLEAAAGGWKREKRAFGALVSSLALALGSATSVETSGAHGATALSLSHAQLQEVRHTGTLGMQGMHGRMDGWMDGRMDWMSVWGPEAVATARGEVASSLELQEPGAKQLPMYPTFVTSVVMPAAPAAVQGDLGLLPALARSDVEELNLDLCKDVPAAVWQQLGQAQGEAFQKLRCFEEYSKGAEGAAGLLLVLSRCQLLQELGMRECSKVPAAAWQLLATARWEQLRKADFYQCFSTHSTGGEGAAGLLSALAHCRQLQDASVREVLCERRAEASEVDGGGCQSDPTGQELLMRNCSQIPAAAWQQLEGAQWPKLTKVDFEGCFRRDSKGIEAAAGLLAFLGRCPELQAPPESEDNQSDPAGQELWMFRCPQIPASAWQQLEGAQWPKLRCFGSDSKGVEAAAGLLALLGRCPELQARGCRPAASQVHLESDLSMRYCYQIPVAAWQQLKGAHWPKLTKVDVDWCFDTFSKGAGGAAVLLAALARCTELQELDMHHCSQIPAAAWQQLAGATWSKLTKVDVEGCFGKNSKGADGAAGLLMALARCDELKELDMHHCSQIPAAAWQQLEGAHWPKLTTAIFYGRLGFRAPVGVFVDALEMVVGACFGKNSKGADGVAGLLTALARCDELKDWGIDGLSEEHLEELRRLRQSSCKAPLNAKLSRGACAASLGITSPLGETSEFRRRCRDGSALRVAEVEKYRKQVNDESLDADTRHLATLLARVAAEKNLECQQPEARRCASEALASSRKAGDSMCITSAVRLLVCAENVQVTPPAEGTASQDLPELFGVLIRKEVEDKTLGEYAALAHFELGVQNFQKSSGNWPFQSLVSLEEEDCHYLSHQLRGIELRSLGVSRSKSRRVRAAMLGLVLASRMLKKTRGAYLEKELEQAAKVSFIPIQRLDGSSRIPTARQDNSLVVLCEDRGASLFASSKTMFQWAADVENLSNLQEEHPEQTKELTKWLKQFFPEEYSYGGLFKFDSHKVLALGGTVEHRKRAACVGFVVLLCQDPSKLSPQWRRVWDEVHQDWQWLPEKRLTHFYDLESQGQRGSFVALAGSGPLTIAELRRCEAITSSGLEDILRCCQPALHAKLRRSGDEDVEIDLTHSGRPWYQLIANHPEMEEIVGPGIERFSIAARLNKLDPYHQAPEVFCVAERTDQSTSMFSDLKQTHEMLQKRRTEKDARMRLLPSAWQLVGKCDSGGRLQVMQFRSAIHERETRSSTIPHFPQEFKQCRGLREEDFRRPARGIHAWTLRAETRRAFRAWLEERRPCSELKELRRSAITPDLQQAVDKAISRDNATDSPDACTPLQKLLLKDILKGELHSLWRLDPSRNPEAERDYAECLDWYYTSDPRIRFSHDEVSDVFLHGAHRGQPVEATVQQLLCGEAISYEIPALVAMEWSGKLYIICGNRRMLFFLKALQAMNTTCEGRRMASSRRSEPPGTERERKYMSDRKLQGLVLATARQSIGAVIRAIIIIIIIIIIISSSILILIIAIATTLLLLLLIIIIIITLIIITLTLTLTLNIIIIIIIIIIILGLLLVLVGMLVGIVLGVPARQPKPAACESAGGWAAEARRYFADTGESKLEAFCHKFAPSWSIPAGPIPDS
ncbi:hypothetical protein AK812_SmicGene31832 [Symbiodinium microadriaticum]|uniref:Uncharacterized protein n=1 Tax=Symbiodinium microadriaticum TaxID=2951 RepID=A0A1Q9CVQ5_SYMMI|nr:hypothetical protein AK812_SmicGene31832 [Symbiodinium microadriaticum]